MLKYDTTNTQSNVNDVVELLFDESSTISSYDIEILEGYETIVKASIENEKIHNYLKSLDNQRKFVIEADVNHWLRK